MHQHASRMNDALAHRGPDAGEIWQDPDVPCILAHRRLSIIDLSPEGAQPMESASGRYIIAYNGEIYNFPELRMELEKFDIPFRGRSDTEVMLAAIEHWGLNQALQKFNGMFAFALWDRKEKCLHFARDRFGKKPLYIGWAGEALIFGSELKALTRFPEFKKTLNPDTLNLYMRYACMPAPHTIYEDVYMLLPGHRLTIVQDTLEPGVVLTEKMECYYNLLETLEDARATTPPLDEHSTITEFETLLQNCVDCRMISDVPLGAFLSGGIDSSAIVALMQKSASSAVKTYTIGFEEAGFNEAEYAKDVAAHLDTDHHELYLSAKDARDIIPHLPDLYDEPFGDISAIPTYLVSKFARGDVTVALSGDGGDEMLGGYNRHVQAPAIGSRFEKVPMALRKLAAVTIAAVPIEHWNRILKKWPQAGTHMHKIAKILTLKSRKDIYQALMEKWLEDDAAVRGAEELGVPLTASQNQPQDLSFAESMMFWDTLSYLPDDILVKVDRASMAVSLEARAPLLDKRIYEYVWQLPENVKVRKGCGKWLLRQVLKRHVPDHLFERPKQGFTMPVAQWLKDPLKDWAEDLLDEKKMEADGILNAQAIRKTWEAHLAGRGNYTDKLWTALMFQSWKRQWLDGA